MLDKCLIFILHIHYIIFFYKNEIEIFIIGTPPRIRTETDTGLSRFPLPVGVEEHICALGFLPPLFLLGHTAASLKAKEHFPPNCSPALGQISKRSLRTPVHGQRCKPITNAVSWLTGGPQASHQINARFYLLYLSNF